MNVFLVESPTQVLNAIEAKHRFGLDDCHLFVLLTGLFDRTMYERVIGTSNWKVVNYVSFYFKAREYDFGNNPPRNIIERMIEIGTILDIFRKRAQIDRLARRVGRVKKLFLGQYRLDTRHYFRHFANICWHEELILLDDGTDTLLINDQRRDETFGVLKDIQISSNNPIKRAIKDRFGKWNTTGVESLTYFTSLRINVNKRDRLLQNDYRYFRSLSRENMTERNRVFFLGQTLVDDGYIRLQDYLVILRRIKEHFSNPESFFYVAHPRESNCNVEVIARTLVVQVCRFDVPIEFEMAVRGNRPRILAGFFCSALENCAMIFGNEIEVQSYLLDSAFLLKHHKEVEDIYAHLKQVAKIEVIEHGRLRA